MKNFPVERVAIVGTGLLGASLGLALKARGYRGTVVGVGRRSLTLRQARAVGAIDIGTIDLARGVAGADLIVLATPISTIHKMLAQLPDLIDPRAIVTDVGSTKRSIVASAERLLHRPGNFVGSHPMAGSECQGPRAAKADLFVGRPCIVTPTATTSPAAQRLVVDLWRGLGMKLHVMSPRQHDQAVARISHLPHALATVLVQLAQRRGGLDIASTGFRDCTRVASGEPGVWADIYADNRAALVAALDEGLHLAAQLRKLLEVGDRAGLLKWLESTKSVRDQWAQRFAGTRGDGE